MIKRLPLGLNSFLLIFLSLVPATYFAWGVLLLFAESIGMYHKKMAPGSNEIFTLRGLTTIVLMGSPFVLAPIVLWGPYTVQGILVDQSFTLILGFLMLSSYILGFIFDKRND
jgi:hypothetical protein